MMRFLSFVFVLCVCGCGAPSPAGLEDALDAAGDNRGELEYALEYFSRSAEDSLKLRACAFLIANMPGHYGYEGAGLDLFRENLDKSFGNNPFLCRALQSIYYRTEDLGRMYGKREDLSVVDGKFLVRHVKHCFDLWKRLPWLHSLTFDEFCDYVLPYRGEHERWEDVLVPGDSLCSGNGELGLVADRYDDIHDLPEVVAAVGGGESCPASVFLPVPFGYYYRLSCYEIALECLFALRAAGVPCVLETVPA